MVVGWRMALHSLSVLLLLVSDASAQRGQARTGAAPADQWTCPLTHPIKGNFTAYSGEPARRAAARGGALRVGHL
jgi:hypothetical protein